MDNSLEVQILLRGGHTVMGVLTGTQFEALMRELSEEKRWGYFRMDEGHSDHFGTSSEIAISYVDVVAVRYAA